MWGHRLPCVPFGAQDGTSYQSLSSGLPLSASNTMHLKDSESKTHASPMYHRICLIWSIALSLLLPGHPRSISKAMANRRKYLWLGSEPYQVLMVYQVDHLMVKLCQLI